MSARAAFSTGAAQGILGEAIALQLASDQGEFSIVVPDIRAKEVQLECAEKNVKEKGLGWKAFYVTGNVSVEQNVKERSRQVRRRI
ncbi:hypothetical protein QCA50_004043 [Cerrena zonata]|uniref:Uncharacterized protein n=1 Tax=Cerrena zonata TaxID=2478898 RepID=A0AAW0GQC2_9APHY